MDWFWNRKPKAPPPLLALNAEDALTLHQVREGVAVIGGIGSGKSSGPGDHLARALLRAGAGFCVLTAKPGEWDYWRKICAATGRTADLVRAAPGTDWRCDLLNNELARPESTADDAARLLAVLLEAQGRESGSGGDDAFWRMSAERDFRRAIHAVWKATGSCSLTSLYRFRTSTAATPEEAKSREWLTGSYCGRCIVRGGEKDPDDYDFNLTSDYFLKELPALSEKTRSVIEAMVIGVLDRFLFGEVARMVSSGETNCPPERIAEGAVCVLDMPVLTWGEPGRFFQILYKTLVQRATLRRGEVGGRRPVVVWMDEAQMFLGETDAAVQTVARSCGLVTVILTQSIPVLVEAFGGGPRAEKQAHALLGQMQTKFVCQNSCHETNEFFSEMLGQARQPFLNVSSPSGGEYDLVSDWLGVDPPGRGGGSAGFSEQNDYVFPIRDWLTLRKGGAENGRVVEAVCYQGGRRFSNGKPWIMCRFRQE